MILGKLTSCKHKDNQESSCIFLYCPRNESQYRYLNAWKINRLYCEYNEDYLKNRYDIVLYQLEQIEKTEIEKGLTVKQIDELNKLRFEIMDIEQKLGVQNA